MTGADSGHAPDEALGFEKDRLNGAEERSGERLDVAVRSNLAAITSTSFRKKARPEGRAIFASAGATR